MCIYSFLYGIACASGGAINNFNVVKYTRQYERTADFCISFLLFRLSPSV